MQSPNEFWLAVHQLLESYAAEGRSTEERNESIVTEFLSLSPLAQRQLLSELAQLALALPEIYPQVVAASSSQSPADDGTPSARTSGGQPATERQ